MRLADFDYDLPPELIAQQPAARRDGSRLLVVRPDATEHRRFEELPAVLPEGALLVVNDTRVLPARLFARKPSGGRIEILLVEPEAAATGAVWRAWIRGASSLRPGTPLALDPPRGRAPAGAPPRVTYLDRDGEDCLLSLDTADLDAALEAWGEVPLPPYIERPGGSTEDDRVRYQTLFAREPGAVAAPTAGLHFTPDVLAALAARGITAVAITLHVGPGTFAPVRDDDVDTHVMHAERYHVPADTAGAVAAARAAGRPVVAIGTTVARTLEAAWAGGAAGGVTAGPGVTRIFIRPGHSIRSFDLLLTNFHMPRSTLLMLVAAFAGRERILAAYRQAVAHRYRFFSYGDATLLHPR